MKNTELECNNSIFHKGKCNKLFSTIVTRFVKTCLNALKHASVRLGRFSQNTHATTEI